MSTASNTTFELQGTETLWTNILHQEGNRPSAVSSTSPSSTTVAGQTPVTVWNVTVLPGMAVYIPQNIAEGNKVYYKALLEAVNAGGRPFDNGQYYFYIGEGTRGDWHNVSATDNNFVPTGTVWVPVTTTLDSIVTAMGMFDRLASAVASQTIASGMASTASSLSSASSSTTTSSSVPTAVSTSGSTSSSSSGSSNDATSTPLISPTSKPGITQDTLAGATAGSFVAGLIICGCIAWLVFRRKRHSILRADRTTSTPPSPRNSSSASVPGGEKLNTPGAAAVVHEHATSGINGEISGWRKHLPQEQDARKIAKSFQDVFAQVELHMDGFYHGKAHTLTPTDVARLQEVASKDLIAILTQTSKAGLVLEAMLSRWIVDGVSFVPGSVSLLPPEYTEVPRKARWQMLSDGTGQQRMAESKHGFRPAFAEWRKLTGFLYAEPATDRSFQADLNDSIKAAVTLFGQAFAPWQSASSPDGVRDESLRRVLHQASESGILLFKQASTYMFDWEAKNLVRVEDLTLTPTLVMRLDEYGQSLEHPTMLLRAKRFGERSVKSETPARRPSKR